MISRYGYFYDSIGRRTSVQNTGTAFTQAGFNRYGYNDRSELTSSERYSGTEITDLSSPVTEENRAYEYDPIGNRKESAAGTQQTLIYETNVLNQYTEISQNAVPVAAPEYDDDGNTLKYKDSVYQWNAENRLVSVQPQNPAAGSKKITFLYDYMGRRVRKQVFVHNGTDWNPAPESEKLFVYEGWNMVKETTVTGGSPSAKYYVWGLDLSQSVQEAGGIGGLLCSAENGTVLYYFYDANGNAGQLVNAADGSTAAHYEYDPFGNTVTSYGAYADENPFRFSTKYFDGETGLYYYGFRYYSPEIGRWWSRDPMVEQGGLNLYVFVINNPNDKADFLGLEGLEFPDAFGNLSYYPPEVDEPSPEVIKPIGSVSISITDVLRKLSFSSVGFDKALPLATIPFPNLGGNVQIDGYGSLKYIDCNDNGIQREWIELYVGLEIYFIAGYSGKTSPPEVKGRFRNWEYIPGETLPTGRMSKKERRKLKGERKAENERGQRYKDLTGKKRDTQGFRQRNAHLDGVWKEPSCHPCPESINSFNLYLFLRGSAGVGIAGAQFNIQQNYNLSAANTYFLSRGDFQTSYSAAHGVWGASVEVGGGGVLTLRGPAVEVLNGQ